MRRHGPLWQFIIMESRLPQALTAMLCGGSLAVSGLMLQTAFKNPLARPQHLRHQQRSRHGRGTGDARHGRIAVGGVSVSITGFMAVLAFAFAGAMAVMALIFLFSTMVRDNVMLLIVGSCWAILPTASSRCSSFFATDRRRQVVYGMGAWAPSAACPCDGPASLYSLHCRTHRLNSIG